LVEHVIRNDGVTGSSPVCGTNFFNPKNLGNADDACPGPSGVFLGIETRPVIYGMHSALRPLPTRIDPFST
jgi:hypothetical protein